MNVLISFSSNDNYIPYVSVMMQSIMENAQSRRKYEFHIMHTDIKKETMNALQKQISSFSHFSVSFIDMSSYVENNNFFTSRHITVEAYFRLFIPYLFPNIKKIIYLDGDMVCNTDISQLFDMDISDFLVAGVRDTAVSWFFQPKKLQDAYNRNIYEYMLSMENPSDYINSGMLLINCEKFREIYSEKDVINTIFSREWQVHDQDVINFLVKDKILYLDYEWDFMPNGDWAKYLPQDLKIKYIEAEKKPKIIHYKPYSYWWYIPKFELFWKYATRTPFVEKIVDRMNKNGIINQNLEDKICSTIRERNGFGGNSILKTIIAFLTRNSRRK